MRSKIPPRSQQRDEASVVTSLKAQVYLFDRIVGCICFMFHVPRGVRGRRRSTASLPSWLARRVSPTPAVPTAWLVAPAPCLHPSDIHHPSFCDIIACDCWTIPSPTLQSRWNCSNRPGDFGSNAAKALRRPPCALARRGAASTYLACALRLKLECVRLRRFRCVACIMCQCS